MISNKGDCAIARNARNARNVALLHFFNFFKIQKRITMANKTSSSKRKQREEQRLAIAKRQKKEAIEKYAIQLLECQSIKTSHNCLN